LEKYKIGEIAELAGVSRRTIDYYTNLGLLSPVRSESKYRYYSQDALVRLKLIEGMKTQRLTLEEIKERLNLLDGDLPETGKDIRRGTINADFIKEQLKQLESQLAQLQPAVAGLDARQTAVLSKQILLQSMALVQTLIIYIHDITPMM
jgi:Predicted transcriptional regulators